MDQLAYDELIFVTNLGEEQFSCPLLSLHMIYAPLLKLHYILFLFLGILYVEFFSIALGEGLCQWSPIVFFVGHSVHSTERGSLSIV